MNMQLACMGSVLSIVSLVACHGVEAPENEGPIADDDVSVEETNEEGVGEATQSLCAYNNNAPPPADDTEVLSASELFEYVAGGEPPGCDPFVGGFTHGANVRFKYASLGMTYGGDCDDIGTLYKRFWYYEPGVGWGSRTGTLTKTQSLALGPGGVYHPVCNVAASSGDFPQNNNYTEVRVVFSDEDGTAAALFVHPW